MGDIVNKKNEKQINEGLFKAIQFRYDWLNEHPFESELMKDNIRNQIEMLKEYAKTINL